MVDKTLWSSSTKLYSHMRGCEFKSAVFYVRVLSSNMTHYKIIYVRAKDNSDQVDMIVGLVNHTICESNKQQLRTKNRKIYLN